MMNKILFVFLTFSLASTVFAHSGGTDKNGCHRESATGTRHCH